SRIRGKPWSGRCPIPRRLALRSHITGVGFHVPERVVTNHDLAQVMDTSDEWIVERTGIRERRFAPAGVGSTELAESAARRAIAAAGRQVEDVDFIVFATITRDYMFPGCGVLLQHRLGLPTIGALDVHNACSGFLYGLSVADAFVRIGAYRCVLLVGAEVQSTGLDLSTRGRDMAVLFGDGAGAAVLEPGGDESGVLAWAPPGEGENAKEVWGEAPASVGTRPLTKEMIDEGRGFPRMNGRQVFKHATVRFAEVIHEALDQAGCTLDQVALLVPHQANMRIADAVGQRLGLPSERVFQNIQKYGNTTAA